jgi:hypothetical protein
MRDGRSPNGCQVNLILNITSELRVKDSQVRVRGVSQGKNTKLGVVLVGAQSFGSMDVVSGIDTFPRSLILIYSTAGAGKSVLTSHIIDAISQQLGNQPDPLPLAYFYCTRESSEPNRSNPTEVLCSILKQLSCKYPGGPMFQCVITKWRERLDLGTEHRLDLDECIDIIIEITSTTGAIIIIDALDELQESTRGQLLDGLDKITQESDRQVHIFVSSRENWDIKYHFRRMPKLEITTADNSHDISNYGNAPGSLLSLDSMLTPETVISELNNRIKSGKLLSGHPPDELVEQIKESIISKADGMFGSLSLLIIQSMLTFSSVFDGLALQSKLCAILKCCIPKMFV